MCRNKSKKSFRKIVGTLNETAGDVIAHKEKTKTQQTWRDDEIYNSLLKNRSSSARGSNAWNRATKLIKARVRKLRNEKLALEAKEINIRSNQRKIDDLFRCFKN